ncbi:MAG: metallophosphoesterase family protein, partial [bacterium]
EKYKFVFAHKPPRTIKKWAYHSFSRGSEEFCDLMTKYAVTSVFLGHIHAYSTTIYSGVEYVVTGGGGAGLSSRYGPLGNKYHYCVVHVGQSAVSHEVVRLAADGSMSRSAGGNEFYLSGLIAHGD